jgi:hypothetical protein
MIKKKIGFITNGTIISNNQEKSNKV